MIDYKTKISSVSIFLERTAKVLWKYLSFSLADNFFSIAKIVSISIETDGIYIVVGTKIFWKTSIKYFKRFPLEENKALTPEYLAATVSQALGDANTTKAAFVLSIPKSWIIVQIAEFPITVKEKLANVISYELDRLTPLTPENAYYDYKIIAEDATKIKILLTVAKTDSINPFLEALRAKNIKIKKLVINTFVIRHLIKRTYHSKNSIFISIKNKAYECAAITNGFTIRSISGTMQQGDDSQIDRIVKETSKLIDLFPKTGTQTKIIVHADEKDFKLFHNKLIKPSVFNLAKDIKLPFPEKSADMSPFALGSFMETATADQDGFNLLVSKNGTTEHSPFITSIALLAVIILLIVLNALSPLFREQKNIDQIDKRINALKPEIKKIEALQQEMAAVSADVKTISDFKKNNISTMNILREITKILPAKTWLTRMRVTDNSVEIEGYAASATEIIPKLENSKYFQKAEFASPTFRDPRQNNERFVIKMELKNSNTSKILEGIVGKNERKK